jgi:hypothetical protein
MATLRNPIPNLEQPLRYIVDMKRDVRGLIIVRAKLDDDHSQYFESVPLRLDQLQAALSACSMLCYGQPEQAERELTEKGSLHWIEVDLTPSDLLQLRLQPKSFSISLDSAPVEEEELTDETISVLDQARASLARGKSISHDEILREFDGD